MGKEPNFVDRHIGTKIFIARTHAGLTQSELGDAVGVKFQQIQKYESGANRVSASRLHDIGQTLGVAPADFFKGLERGHDEDVQIFSKEALAFVAAVNALEPKTKKAFVKLTQSMAVPEAPDQERGLVIKGFD